MKVRLLVALLLVALSAGAQVDKMLGKWDSVDDKSGDKRSTVYIYKAVNGKYYGKILCLYAPNGDGTYTTLTESPAGYEGVIGMVILRDLEPAGKDLKGRCYDPESKKTYYGKISYNADKNTVTLRGSIDKLGLIGRSQTWVRSE